MPQNRTYSFSALFSFKIDHTFFFSRNALFFSSDSKNEKNGHFEKKACDRFEMGMFVEMNMLVSGAFQDF